MPGPSPFPVRLRQTVSGVLADNRGKFRAEMFGIQNAAPLIVIDVKRGARKFGTLALYELPALLLQLLHLDNAGPIELTASQAVHVRPIPGLHYLVSNTCDVDLARNRPGRTTAAAAPPG